MSEQSQSHFYADAGACIVGDSASFYPFMDFCSAVADETRNSSGSVRKAGEGVPA